VSKGLFQVKEYVYGAVRIVKQCPRSRQNSTAVSTEKEEKRLGSRQNSTKVSTEQSE
jgi:hypothetical protein